MIIVWIGFSTLDCHTVWIILPVKLKGNNLDRKKTKAKTKKKTKKNARDNLMTSELCH